MSQPKLATLIADFETSLATKMAIGATEATLLNATDDDGVALPTGRYFLTLDGNNSSKEHISCTLTSTSLTDIKTLSRQGVETSGCLRAHRVGAKVILTDWAHLKVINNLLDGTTKFNASTPLEYDGTTTPTTANQIVPKSYVDGVAIAGGADASTTVKGISKLSVTPVSATEPISVGDNDGRVPTQNENDALVGTSGTAVSSSNKLVDQADTTGTGLIIRSSKIIPTYGGNGTDGALSISSGTTNIDLGGADYFVKNYSSISITGTGKLTFSNPATKGTIIIIKCSGNATITSSTIPAIDFSGLGATTPGLGHAYTSLNSLADLPTGGTHMTDLVYGANGEGGGSNTYNGNGGIMPSALRWLIYQNRNLYKLSRNILLVVGAGGGNGHGASNFWGEYGGGAGSLWGNGQGANNGTVGLSAGGQGASYSSGPGGATNGGKGGGAFMFDILGDVTISSEIHIKGLQGADGTANDNCGGGGAGGMGVVLYGGTLSNTGVYNNAGGRGGNNGSVNGGAGGATYGNPVIFLQAII